MRKYLVAVLSAAALVAGVVTASPASALSLSTGDLSGTVTDGGGAPVSGATILVNGGNSATTDSSGHYTVADLPPGTVNVNASKAGYLDSVPVPATINVSAITTQDITIVQTSTISGTVFDPSNAPLSGATVTLSGAAAATTTSANDGTYSFADLAPGVYNLDFDAANLVSPATQTVTITVGGSTPTVDATLLAPASISGTVLDPANAPAVGVTVTASGPVNATATSANDGSYTLDNLAAGDYSLTFHLDGYVDPAPITVTVHAAGDAVSAPAVNLLAPSSISGTVSDGAAAPIAGATVTIDVPATATTTTDNSGAYVFNNLPAGDYSLTVSADGYVDSTPVTVTITSAGDTATHDVTLSPTSSVDVYVADTHALPVDNAAVTIDGAYGTFTGSTDASGHVLITGLAPGDYTITSTAIGYFTAPGTPFTVTDFGTTYEVAVPVLSPASVSGIVTDPAGNPLPGASVSLEGNGVSLATSSGPDGSYTFDQLDIGQYTVSASYPGYVPPTPQTVQVLDYGSTATAQLAFQTGSSIVGEATIVETPTEGVTVTISGPVNETTTTAPDGTYSFGVLPLGTYTVSFDLNGYISPADQEVTITTAGSTTTVDGELNIPAAITGTVVDPTGAPLAGATVTADGPVFVQVTTGADGTYQLTGLDLGTYSVTVHADGYIDPPAESVTVTSYGSGTVLNLAVNAPSTISGTVTGAAGPVEGATVTVDGLTWATTTTAPDGTYSLGTLPPGSYDLTVTADGYLDSSTITVDVPAFGSSVTQDVALVAAASADVLVTDAALSPLADAAVNVVGADGNTYLGTTDGTGHAAIVGLPAGTYTATASLDGYLEGSANFTVDTEGSVVGVHIALNAADVVSGTITDTSETPIEGAMLTLTNSEGDRTTFTAADGTYDFSQLGPDTYTLSIAADGFISPLPQTVTVTGFGATVTVNAALFKVGEVVAPGAPTAVHAIPGDKQATVSWTAPTNDGGTPIYKYTVTAITANTALTFLAAPNQCTTDGTTTSCTVTGLTNGVPYVFSVVATNIAGDSAAALSGSILTYGRPTAVTGLKVAPGNTFVKISWKASSGNGLPLTGYLVKASPTGHSCSTTGLSCTVTGLKDGQVYVFTVWAKSLLATSVNVTIKGTPSFVPGVTSIKWKTAGYGKATITFAKPRTSEKIVDYKIEIQVQSKWSTYNDGKSTKTSITVKGKKSRTYYKARITPIPSRGTAITSKSFFFKTG